MDGNELEDGEIPSDRESNPNLGETETEENEIDKIIDEVCRTDSPKESSNVPVNMKTENNSNKRQRLKSTEQRSRSSRREKKEQNRERSSKDRRESTAKGHVPFKNGYSQIRYPHNRTTVNENSSKNASRIFPQNLTFFQMPSTSLSQYYQQSYIDHIPSLPPLLPPPPPPPPLQSQFVSNSLDNYESSDMDIDESDRTAEESEKIDDEYLNDMRSNLLQSQAARSESKLKQDIRRQERIILTNEHLLRKRKEECRELVEKYILNKKMRAEYKEIIQSALIEKDSLELKLKNIRFRKLRNDEIIAAEDISHKELDSLAKRFSNQDDLSDGTNSEPLIMSSESIRKQKDPENENSEKFDAINLSREMSEEEMRKKLLETFKRREGSQQMEDQLQKKQDDIEDERSRKGRQMLSNMCRFDMNGICSRAQNCRFMHLDDAHFDERLFLSSLFREIYQYNESDIGLIHRVLYGSNNYQRIRRCFLSHFSDGAVNQMMLMRSEYSGFSPFLQMFLSRTMSKDSVVRNRFYQFFKKGNDS